MRRFTSCGRPERSACGSSFAALGALILALAFALPGVVLPAAALQANQEFSPASGPAHVIAQGVVALPAGDAVWRTVRTRAPLLADAPFEARPLGFVLASAGPLLLVDQTTGEQVRLGSGEAAMVRDGTVQQRSSLGAQPASYLSIELVSVGAPAPPVQATVLQPGQPFPAPAGLHDLDLLSANLTANEMFIIPDSGAKNVVLVTGGAANVGRPGGEPVVLLAGEAASFSGELQVQAAGASGGGENEEVSFVVAMIGPEVSLPEMDAGASATAATSGTPAASGQGAIVVEVFTCPPGMDADSVAAAACAPTLEDFDVTISGEMLAAPLTLGDAAASAGAFTWSDLPYGDYLIVEAVLPAGSTTYILSARDTAGDAATGYRVRIDAANPEPAVRIYNFDPS